ncbi:DUF488 family protein, N3 subclade [Streptomyces kaempferi]|uniref:DUF488 family protein n=1 Tax=Streptomyces kaempferi TaxID=333725 RepID=A0ABW3XDR9_9ACTN
MTSPPGRSPGTAPRGRDRSRRPRPRGVPGRQRIHEDTSSRDGERVLVDRRCPRGMSKERAHLDERLRDAAPPRTRAGQHRTLSAITWRRSGSRCRGSNMP